MSTDMRRDGTKRTHVCEHGLSPALDGEGNPRCVLCRRAAGLPIPVAPPGRAPRGRCPVPGHAPYRIPCVACAGELAAHRRPPA